MEKKTKNLFRKKKIILSTLRDTIPFGKYKGRTLKWVFQNDPNYGEWLRDECKSVELSPEMKSELTVWLFLSA